MIRNSRPFLATKLCQILFQTHNQMKATNMLLYGIEGENSKITGCVHPGSLRGEIVSFPFLVAGGCLHAWGGALSLSLFLCPLPQTLLPFSRPLSAVPSSFASPL